MTILIGDVGEVLLGIHDVSCFAYSLEVLNNLVIHKPNDMSQTRLIGAFGDRKSVV